MLTLKKDNAVSNLFELLEEFDTNKKKQLILAGDFNLFLTQNLMYRVRMLEIFSLNSSNLKELMT